MDQPQAHRPTQDHHVAAALEASCGALLALEVARLEMVDSEAEVDAAMRELEQAMVSVRRAIDLLHAGPTKDAEMLSLGFVLGAGD